MSGHEGQDPEGRDADSRAEHRLRQQAKQVLRQRMRAVRKVLPLESCEARSAAICQRLMALPEFGKARVVIAYTAFRKEADPAEVLRQAHGRGKRTGLVRVEDTTTLSLRLHAPGDTLQPNAMGIPEPLASAPAVAPEEVDLVVLPALGLDERGYRLGYGGGYYDRLLPRLPNAHRIAIAYDFQLLAEIPETDGDERVDAIVTDERVLRSM